jgi:hypothetical protein
MGDPEAGHVIIAYSLQPHLHEINLPFEEEIRTIEED